MNKLGIKIIVWCLCDYFVWKLNEKLGVVDQQLPKTVSRKQQNTDNGFSLVKKPDIMFEVLHKLNPLEPISMQQLWV